MQLQRHVTRESVDQVSDVLGDRRHLLRWYPDGLTEACLGPMARDRINVTRLYLFITPQVVVDYEPAPSQGRFYVEEKRRFFTGLGIVYVPIFLRERLTREQFKARVREELTLLRKAQDTTVAVRPTPYDIDRAMQAPEILLRIDDAVRQRMQTRTLYGAAKAAWLRRTRAEVTALVREQVVKDGLAHV
jgi:hypothetical protein